MNYDNLKDGWKLGRKDSRNQVFLLMPTSLINIFSDKKELAYFSFLYNRNYLQLLETERREEHYEGWFHLSYKSVKKYFLLSRAAEGRILKKLRNKKLIRSRVMDGKTREFFIDGEKLLEATRLDGYVSLSRHITPVSSNTHYTKYSDNVLHKQAKKKCSRTAHSVRSSGTPNDRNSTLEEVMALFQEIKDESKRMPAELYLQMAHQLRDITLSLGFNTKWSKIKWAKVFRRTTKIEAAGNYVRVQNVLDWYEENAKRINKPKIQAASNFRSCFYWLEELIEKTIPEKVKISKEVKPLLRVMSHLTWPKGCKSQVPFFIQQSYANFVEWRTSVRDFIPELSFGKSKYDHLVVRTVIYIWENIPPPQRFIEEWVKTVNENVLNWDNWNGDLRGFIFTPNHKMFTTRIRTLGTQYGIPMNKLGRTIEELLKCNSGP